MSLRERIKTIRNRQRTNLRAMGQQSNFIRKSVIWTMTVLVAITKPLPFLHPHLPRMMQLFIKSWDYRMLKTYIFSFGRKAYMDQPCEMTNPPDWKPLASDADPRFRLSEAEIKSFYENGFIGPFTLCPPEEMAQLREQLWQEIEEPSKIYGFTTGRDRHLDCPTVWKVLQRPEWTERLASLLGSNLLLWRSQLFLKMPGAPEVTWHQASTYLSEEGYKATLWPPDRDRLFQLTTWVAFDDVDLENGCMQFLKGTHRSINTMTIGGEGAEGFAKARVKLDVDIKPEMIVDMPMKAGQFVIFSERCIHGSPPNSTTDRRRWGMAFRAIQPEVKVYDHEMRHHVFYLQEEFSLENWGAVVLRGKDTAGLNKVITPCQDVRDAQIVRSAGPAADATAEAAPATV